MNTLLIWIIILTLFGWVVYWSWIHPKFKIKEKNKELLELEYKRLNERVFHIQIIGFTFLITGLAIPEGGNKALFLLALGFILIIGGLMSDGRAERRYRAIREMIINKKKTKN